MAMPSEARARGAVVTFDEVAGGADVTDTADVVVVGSGAGGGAIAAELAEGRPIGDPRRRGRLLQRQRFLLRSRRR